MGLPTFHRLSEQYETLLEQFTVMQAALAPLNLTRWQLVRLLGAQIWRDTSPTIRTGLIVLVSGVLILTLDAVILHPYVYSLRRLGIPKLSPSKGKHAFDYKPMLDEAARKYPDRPWLFAYSGFEFVVFPSAYVEEVRRLPARKASLVDFLTTVQFGGWHLIGPDDSSNTLHKTASTDLARSVGNMGVGHQQAARRACESTIGPCPDRDPRWLKAVQRLPIAVGVGLYISCLFPRLLRPIIATIFYSPAWLLYRWMAYLLRPTLEQAVKDFQQTNTDTKQGREKQPQSQGGTTLVNLLMARYKPEEFQADQLIRDVITATFESAPATAVSIYWMLIEIILRPDLIDELREELATVMKDGKLPPTQLAELPKMDSLMRESARVNTFHYLGLSRILRSPVQFSVGPKLPKGTIICVDQDNIHNSSTLYTDPQYTSNGPDLLTWGDRPQVCPGRVFGGNTIKILLAHLLINYDLKLEPGKGKPPRLSFPNGSVQPDMNFKFMIRKRRV
ncbi:cytochrome P450 [Cadophora sp. DSE1049]|nr:cytochrome P450 [Cadophora sp. DSE1049]